MTATVYAAWFFLRKKPKNTAVFVRNAGKRLTIGVMNRVEELADRKPEEFGSRNCVPFYSLIPLDEIIAEAFNVGVGAKK